MTSTVKIPEGWIETTLKDCVSILGDGLHGTPIYDDNGKYFFVNGNNLSNGKIIIKGDTKKVSESEYLKYKKDLNNRTIFVSINGTLGNFATYRNEKIILGKSACYFNVLEENDLNYIKYVIINDDFQKYLVREATGTTIKNASLQQLRNYKFILPPLPEQKAIAGVLSSFDDKIELLRAENQTLEEMGQTLFKERFGKYKVGDELIKAEKVLNFERGIEVGSDNYFNTKDTLNNPIYFYRVGDIINNGNRSQIYCEKELLNNKIFKETDVLVSFDGTVGRVFIGGKGGFSTGLRKIFSKDNTIKNSFIYFWANSEYVQNTISLYSEGTTIQHASKAIPNLEIVKSLQEINKITEQFDTVFNKIISNLEEINTLTSTRDQLLPKLMSGEVRVEF